MKGLSSWGSSGSCSGHLHSARLGPGLVAEFHQCHEHGQAQASDQDVEDPRHVAQAQSARLVLQEWEGDGTGEPAIKYNGGEESLHEYEETLKADAAIHTRPQKTDICSKTDGSKSTKKAKI